MIPKKWIFGLSFPETAGDPPGNRCVYYIIAALETDSLGFVEVHYLPYFCRYLKLLINLITLKRKKEIGKVIRSMA